MKLTKRKFKQYENKWGLTRKEFESFIVFGMNPDEITEEHMAEFQKDVKHEEQLTEAISLLKECNEELEYSFEIFKKVAQLADDLEGAGVFYPGEHKACPICDITSYSSFSHARDCLISKLKDPIIGNDVGLFDRLAAFLKKVGDSE